MAIDVTRARTDNRPHNNVTMDDVTSRLDGEAKVTGRARYAADQLDSAPLVGGFLRCPWGSAELVAVDLESARSVPGVLLVDVPDENVGRTFEYHGQDYGQIVAESMAALKRGIAAVEVRWRHLPVRPDLESAIDGGSEPLTDDRERLDDILARADVVVDQVYRTQVQTHSCLETHGGRIDFKGDSAIYYCSTQAAYGCREGLPLDLPESAVEVHCEYVGAGFGSKLFPGKTGLLAARMSRRFGRPVRVFCDRVEEHLDTGHRPSSRVHLTIGATEDGKVVGGRFVSYGGTGVIDRGGGVSRHDYRLGELINRHEHVSYNSGPPAPFRAPGSPQGAFAVELMMDELAAKLGMDPLDLKRSNDPAEVRQGMYDKGATLIGWEQRKANGTQTGTVKTGYGVGITEWSYRKVHCEAEVIINRDGSVEARSGTQDMGQGQRTAMGVVVATAIGIPLARVQSLVGSTTYPVGPASGGSKTASNLFRAMTPAALDARAKLLTIAAENLGVDSNQLTIEDGHVVSDGTRRMTWDDACKLLRRPVTGRAEYDGDQTRGQGAEGVQFARVAVDTETGLIDVKRIVAIQSGGRIICRKTAESQVIGGVIQGLSYALFENRLLDRQTGAMVNTDLEMYKVAGSLDMPEIVPVLWDVGDVPPCGIGEAPTVTTAAAIACAVYNAIGVPVRSLPLTPDAVLAALDGKEDET